MTTDSISVSSSTTPGASRVLDIVCFCAANSYAFSWPWQFSAIDEKVKKINEAKRAAEPAEPKVRENPRQRVPPARL